MPSDKGRKRVRLAEAQNWRCAYCAGAVLDRGKGPAVATLEHVKPRSRGGSEDRANLVVACCACNGARQSSYSAMRFYELRTLLLVDGSWPACEAPSRSVLRRVRESARELSRKPLFYSVEEVLEHLAQHHPGCAPELRNALAHLVARRNWRQARIGMAVGITMTEFVRDTLTDFTALRQTGGVPDEVSQAWVSSQISEVIRGWRSPPSVPTFRLRLVR